MPTFRRLGACLHHFELRAGTTSRAIVFINSLGTDFRIWDGVVARLPSDIPTLRYDKAGHGLSLGDTSTIDRFASDLAGLMESLDIRQALICGVSIGGMIAQALAATRPDLVTGLLLSNTSFRIGTPQSWAERIATLDKGGLEQMADTVIERWLSLGFRAHHPDATSGFRTMLTRTPTAGYRAACVAIRDADLEASARSLTVPTLCLAGEADLATPPEGVWDLAKAIPGAAYLCLEGVGHLPGIEVPDIVAQHLIQLHGELP